MIRIDSIWLATEPMDMRAGTETALARVIAVFGAAQPHCAYLFANRRATRMACSGKIGTMTLPNLDHLNPEQLRALAAQFAHGISVGHRGQPDLKMDTCLS